MKVSKKILLAFASILLLAGCSETDVVEEAEVQAEAPAAEEADKQAEAYKQAEADKKADEDKKAAEAKKLKEEEEAKKAKAAADEKAKADAKAAEDAKKAEAAEAQAKQQLAYFDFSSDFSYQLSDLMMEFSGLMSNANQLDQDWIMDVAINLSSMDILLQTVRDYSDKEIPSGFESVHALTLKAVDEYQYLPDELPTAIDNMDAAAIEKAITHLDQGNQYIEEATAELNAMMEE